MQSDRQVFVAQVGLILLTPPLARIFQLDAKIAGVPFTAVYLFAVWALLIASAAALSRRLRDGVGPAEAPGPAEQAEQQGPAV